MCWNPLDKPTIPVISVPRLPLIDLGDLRRLAPVDAGFGTGRGKPIDRHYIEAFLESCSADIKGRVLEVAESAYTDRYGQQRVTQREVLHIDPAHAPATFVGDLADGDSLPSEAFDCFICTQTLQYVYPLEQAAATMQRILKPGGVLLLTVPGISQISPYDREHWGEHWRFTPQSVQRLLASSFEESDIEVQGHGNVLASIGFLHGLACEDLTEAELDHQDDRYPMLVTARAVKN